MPTVEINISFLPQEVIKAGIVELTRSDGFATYNMGVRNKKDSQSPANILIYFSCLLQLLYVEIKVSILDLWSFRVEYASVPWNQTSMQFSVMFCSMFAA